MASAQHQYLMRIVAQKMVHDGFRITHWDGQQSKLAGGGTLALPLPPSLGKHRPDTIGFHSLHQIFGIGEAKTLHDLESARTYKQFREFSSISMENNSLLCQLYIGVPQHALQKARTLLVDIKLHGKSNIHLMAVPDIFLSEK